jgi:hypothetical protein
MSRKRDMLDPLSQPPLPFTAKDQLRVRGPGGPPRARAHGTLVPPLGNRQEDVTPVWQGRFIYPRQNTVKRVEEASRRKSFPSDPPAGAARMDEPEDRLDAPAEAHRLHDVGVRSPRPAGHESAPFPGVTLLDSPAHPDYYKRKET